MEQAEQQKASIVKCVEVDVKNIMEGDQGKQEQIVKSYQALELVIKGVNLDDSLASALPSTCLKQPSDRGAFDTMVLDQLDKSLKDKVTELTRMLEEGAAAKGQRAAAVEAAQSDLTAALASEKTSGEELAVAEGHQKEASAAVASAKNAVDSHEPELTKANQAFESTQAELDNFETYNMGCLNTLRGTAKEKVATPPEEAPDQKASAPPEEAPGVA